MAGFDPDKYLASKQAAQADAPSTGAGFNPDQYLQSKGIQTLPNGGQIQDGATAAKAATDAAMGSPGFSQRLQAFGGNLLNAALGGFGDRFQAAAQAHQLGGPSYDQSLANVRSQQDQADAANPGTGFAGTVLGMGLGGIPGGELSSALGEGITSKLAADEAVPATLKSIEMIQGKQAAFDAARTGVGDLMRSLPGHLAELGALSTEGGINSIGLNRADDLKSAIDDFKTGASVTGLLGATVKAGQGTFSLFADSPAAAGLKASAKYGKDTGDYVLDNSDAIEKRIANLPDYTRTTLNNQIQQLNQLKNTRLDGLARDGVTIDLTKPLEQFHSSLEGLDEYPDEANAATTAQKLLKDYETKIAPDEKVVGIKDADDLKQFLQDQWINGKMSKYQGTDAYKAFRTLEKNVRDGIADQDPKIGVYNDLSYNFRNAMNDVPSRTTFEQLASDRSKGASQEDVIDFNRHFNAKQDSSTSFDNRFNGLKDTTLADPEAQAIIGKTKALIDAEAEPAMRDFFVLNQVKGSQGISFLNKWDKLLETPASIGNRLGQVQSITRYAPPQITQPATSFLQGLGRSLMTQGPSRLGIVNGINTLGIKGALTTIK